MEEKLIAQIKFYKTMIRAYDEVINERPYDTIRLLVEKGIMLMVIEDLEKLVGDAE